MARLCSFTRQDDQRYVRPGWLAAQGGKETYQPFPGDHIVGQQRDSRAREDFAAKLIVVRADSPGDSILFQQRACPLGILRRWHQDEHPFLPTCLQRAHSSPSFLQGFRLGGQNHLRLSEVLWSARHNPPKSGQWVADFYAILRDLQFANRPLMDSRPFLEHAQRLMNFRCLVAKLIGRGCLLCVGLFLLAAPVYSWNAFGHRTVAKIACLEISDAQQKAIFNLLKNHPHFAVLKDFPKPGVDTEFFSKNKPAGVSEVEWAILQAATWPDFVRPSKFTKMTPEQIQAHPVFKFHRRSDHFADIPLIDPDFKQALKLGDSGSLLEAIAKAENVLKDKNSPLPEKAIAFCWLAHLVGDIHQPLHCTSYFSKDYPTGDGGGNAFLIGKTNLHSFWDDVLGSDPTPFEHFDAVSQGIYRAQQLQRSKLLELTQSVTFKSWAEESHAIAVSFTYKDGKIMLKGGRGNHDHDDGPLVIPDFPLNYKVQAKSVAERRVALGGYRLADKINVIFGQ